METWNWCNGCVSSDKSTCQCWWASASARGHQEGKDFSSVIHCDSFALWCIVVKNKANSRVLRSSIVVHSKELFMRDCGGDWSNWIGRKAVFSKSLSILLLYVTVILGSYSWRNMSRFFLWTERLFLHFNNNKMGTKWNKFAWENQKFTCLAWSSMFIQRSSETSNSNWWSLKELM